MKYWNARRVRREREKNEKRERRAFELYLESEAAKRTYARGDSRKNARLMLEALGKPVRRRMLARLQRRGAMSVTYLARPFHMMLPAAMRHLDVLERAGLIVTHKRGRIRFCTLNRKAAGELAAWLVAKEPFDLD